MTACEFATEYFSSPVKPDMRLVDLVSDSLEKADLVLELENAFGVDIPDDDFVKLCTIQDVENYLNSRSINR